MNIYNVYEIDFWTFKHNSDFTLGNSLFVAVKLTKNADFDICKYSGYGIGLDKHETFSLSDGSGFGKNAIIFVADMNSSVHIDNKKKDILILGKGPKYGLDDTTLTAEKEYSINFTEQKKKNCISALQCGKQLYIC